MQIHLKEKIEKDIKRVSRELGVNENQIVDRALLLYLESIKETIDLKKELLAWDMLSDEVLMRTDGF